VGIFIGLPCKFLKIEVLDGILLLAKGVFENVGLIYDSTRELLRAFKYVQCNTQNIQQNYVVQKHCK
jgi:hypothetical protein